MSDKETNNLRRGFVVVLKRSRGESNGLIACKLVTVYIYLSIGARFAAWPHVG